MRGPVQTIDSAKLTRRRKVEQQVFKEAAVSGFPHIDQEVAFFVQVAALLRPDDVVLDFGAGRGEFMDNDPSLFRRQLQNFRGRCEHVDGCDIDPVVLDNPTLDAAAIMEMGKPLPYPDERFDLIVSRYVFEHVQNPEETARELLRVLKPGGWICVMTPNSYGYVALASRLIPNRLHSRALRKIQIERKEEDVFPTAYQLNRPKAVRRHFGHAADVYHYSTSAVPSYFFGRVWLFRLMRLVHRLTPPPLDVGLRFFIQKR